MPAQHLQPVRSPLIQLTTEQIAQFRDEGFLLVRGVFSPAEIGEMVRGCDQLEQIAKDRAEDFFQGSCYFNLHRDCEPYAKNIADFKPERGLLRRVTYPYLVSPTFDFLRTHPPLLHMVSALLGEPDVVQITNQVNFNHPGRGTGWGWHQDYRFRRAGITDLVHDFVQSLTAIDRCYVGNGGIRLVPKSHQLGELALDLDIEHAEKRFDATTAVTPDMAPGDVVFFNALVIHGSTANRSNGPRRVFINGFAKASACNHGVPVYRGGLVLKEAKGSMEYEKQTQELPHTSKY
jgi:hypothetical protein